MTPAERECKSLMQQAAAILAAKREAIAHGHPLWSHLIAHGPCTIPSKFDNMKVSR